MESNGKSGLHSSLVVKWVIFFLLFFYLRNLEDIGYVLFKRKKKPVELFLRVPHIEHTRTFYKMARRRVCAQAIVVNNKHAGKFMSESNDLTENAHTHIHTGAAGEREKKKPASFTTHRDHLVLKWVFVVVHTKVGKRGLEKQDSFILDVIFHFSLREAKREKKKPVDL